MAKGSVAHPECVAQPGVWGEPAAGGPSGEQWHSRRQGSTGGFASLRARRVRLGRLCTLQIPGWFQRSGHLKARGGGRGRDGGSVGDGRACAVAVCGRRTVRGWVGGGWSAVRCGACVVGRGAWGVGRGFRSRAAPVDPAQLYDIFIDIFLVDRRDWQCKPHTLGDRGLLEVCIGFALDADSEWGRGRPVGLLQVRVGGEQVHLLDGRARRHALLGHPTARAQPPKPSSAGGY